MRKHWFHLPPKVFQHPQYSRFSEFDWARFFAICDMKELVPFEDANAYRCRYQHVFDPDLVVTVTIGRMRLLAKKTKLYAGSSPPERTIENGRITRSSVRVFRIIANGSAGSFAGTAYREELAAAPGVVPCLRPDWLDLCAEAEALRVAFPDEMMGLRLFDEIQRLPIIP